MPLPSLFSGYIRRTLTLTSSVARRNYHSLDKLATPTLVEPGKCVLNEEWTSLPLLFKKSINHDTTLFSFSLNNSEQPLNLSTCACVLAGTKDSTGELVVRPYTPISTNKQLGRMDLIVKIYKDGIMTTKLNNLSVGETLDFKHIPFNVKVQYPFNKKRILMIAGGSGITPMIQALYSILGTSNDTTKVDLVYCNKTSNDISVDFNDWIQQSNGRLHVHHVLSDEPNSSKWEGDRGFITKEILERVIQSDETKTELVFVCGPTPMYELLCGDRTHEELKECSILDDMGFNTKQVYKF